MLECAILNRFRGTGVIKHFGTLNVGKMSVRVNLNGSILYGLYLAILIGCVGASVWLGLAVLVAYLVGESKGWGEWEGSLTRWEPWDRELIELVYKDEEGKTFPFIYQIANSIVKEKIEGSLEEQCRQYRKHATLAIVLRGIYWWLPVYMVMAMFGMIGYGEAVVIGVLLGIGFPIACEIGRRWKYEKVYDLKFIKLSFSRGWENQEIVYGAMQGAALWYVLIG